MCHSLAQKGSMAQSLNARHTTKDGDHDRAAGAIHGTCGVWGSEWPPPPTSVSVGGGGGKERGCVTGGRGDLGDGIGIVRDGGDLHDDRVQQRGQSGVRLVIQLREGLADNSEMGPRSPMR